MRGEHDLIAAVDENRGEFEGTVGGHSTRLVPIGTDSHGKGGQDGDRPMAEVPAKIPFRIAHESRVLP